MQEWHDSPLSVGLDAHEESSISLSERGVAR
jgi:hypothetical protein